VDRTTAVRRAFFVVFLVWCLSLAAAFIHASSNFSAIQNTQSSVRSQPTNLTMQFNETEGLITIKVRIENGGRLDIEIYEIPTQVFIRNLSAANQWLEIGQANGRTRLGAGEVVELTLKVQIDMQDPSPSVENALRHVKPGVEGASRVWLVYGRVLFYVDPFDVRGESALCAGELVKCVI
jgi:hypothetical protein